MSRHELKSEVTGSIWKIETTSGQKLDKEHTVMIIESMKMEIPLVAEEGGTLVEICVNEGDAVNEGQVLAIIER
ncbi:MAG: biotin/lipoyl-binding carrier protein [Alcaligenaceae bacterium]|nr:biotin/lipoyl-binding carrier protein [Alcaligenaceae bacterium]